jgi:hypothetical protein
LRSLSAARQRQVIVDEKTGLKEADSPCLTQDFVRNSQWNNLSTAAGAYHRGGNSFTSQLPLMDWLKQTPEG